jgi:hypothetical protein
MSELVFRRTVADADWPWHPKRPEADRRIGVIERNRTIRAHVQLSAGVRVAVTPVEGCEWNRLDCGRVTSILAELECVEVPR